MAVTSLSTKGQIIIPKSIREALGLRPGVKIIVELEGDGVILRPVEGIGLLELTLEVFNTSLETKKIMAWK
jgi:antitoxin PrlF